MPFCSIDAANEWEYQLSNQLRQFCNKSLNDGENQIFNIGNDSEPISIKKLAEKVINLTNSKTSQIEIPFKESNRNRKEILHRSPDIDKAKKLLGYHPKQSVQEALDEFVEWYKSEQL